MKETRNLLWKQMSALTPRVPTGVPKPSILCGRGKVPQGEKGERTARRKEENEQSTVGETVQNRLRRKREAKGREGTPVPGVEGLQAACYAEVLAGGLSELGQKS